MTKLPVISSYGNYESSNYGAHTLKVCFEQFDLYYSYETIVAYYEHQDGLVCSKNVWGTTTGKHLNWIEPDKKSRVDNQKFEEMLQSMLERRTK